MKKTVIAMAICLPLLVWSCQKDEGKGGTLTIRGKVWVDDYTSGGNYKGSYYGMDEDVYLIYGDNAAYDDATTTSYNGTYEFANLYPGSYTLYAYSDCDTCISGTSAVVSTIEIEGKGEIIEGPTLTIRR